MKGFENQPASWLAWWRERVPFEHKAAIAVLALAALLIGGWLVADNLSAASAGTSQQASAAASSVRTVDMVVTVRDPRKPVTTRSAIVRHVYRTRTETLPAATVVRTTTDYATRTVTVPRFVTHVVTAPARTVVATQTVTDATTTVEWRVVTVVEKSKPVTVTAQAP